MIFCDEDLKDTPYGRCNEFWRMLVVTAVVVGVSIPD